MNGTYKAKIINIDGTVVTYEYTDENGFVQITSQMPSGISISKGDIVWITIQDGVVVSVGKRRKMMSTPFGVKLAGLLTMIIFIAVLWLIFVVIKKIIIALIWIIVIFFAAVFLIVKFKRH